MLMRWLSLICIATLAISGVAQPSVVSTNSFALGDVAYRAGDFAAATAAYRASAAAQLASGTLQNLGNAEWRRGHTAEAILAWEQALWVNPFDKNARNNLRFARQAAQIEAPELRWYEIASGWLPVNWWAWIVGGSLWTVVGALTLPGVLRRRRASWQQAVAALALGVFLLSLPAHFGTLTRTRLGVVLPKDTPLRLTPTAGAEAITRLAAGEPARWVRARGSYLFIRTNRGAGWIERGQFALICRPVTLLDASTEP